LANIKQESQREKFDAAKDQFLQALCLKELKKLIFCNPFILKENQGQYDFDWEKVNKKVCGSWCPKNLQDSMHCAIKHVFNDFFIP
jgi:hypothetical protein